METDGGDFTDGRKKDEMHKEFEEVDDKKIDDDDDYDDCDKDNDENFLLF